MRPRISELWELLLFLDALDFLVVVLVLYVDLLIYLFIFVLNFTFVEHSNLDTEYGI